MHHLRPTINQPRQMPQTHQTNSPPTRIQRPPQSTTRSLGTKSSYRHHHMRKMRRTNTPTPTLGPRPPTRPQPLHRPRTRPLQPRRSKTRPPMSPKERLRLRKLRTRFSPPTSNASTAPPDRASGCPLSKGWRSSWWQPARPPGAPTHHRTVPPQRAALEHMFV